MHGALSGEKGWVVMSRSMRLRGLRRLTHWLGGAVAVGAVVAAAGCSPGGTSSAPASAPATTSAPASSSAPAPSTSPSAHTATPTSDGASGCATQDLRVALGAVEGAAGSAYVPIEFTNISGAACTLYGYPGVSLLAGTPLAQVGAAASRSTAAPSSLVTLAPGQTGNALLRVVDALNYPTATCSPTPTTQLRVYPPNQTASVDLAFKSTGCSSTSVNLLTIGVVQAGSGSDG